MKLEFVKMLSTKLILFVQQIRMLSGNVKQSTLSTVTKKICPTELGKIFHEKYGHLLSEPNNIANETWVNMREYLMSFYQSPMFADGIIMDTLVLKNHVDGAVSYYNFLKTNDYDIPIPILLKYLELYSLKKPLSETEKAYIYTTCKDLMETHTSLDTNSATSIINVFCRIDKWEHAIKIIKMFEKNDSNFLRIGYSHIIEYLYLHGHTKLGYEYLTESMKNGGGPKNAAYNAYLEHCIKDKDTFTENVEKLFKLWSIYGIKPSAQVIRKYITVCNTFGWHATLTTISSLTCVTCKQKLPETLLTEMETHRLLTAVRESLLLTNMYSATQPEEIKRFAAFINARKPFDIIIDVLNVIHSTCGSYKLLKKFLNQYKSRGNKILLITRRHTAKILQSLNFHSYADCFLVENGSSDDLFLLYAAFSSGPNCKLVSEDFMRNHKFAIRNPELNVLFYKWQRSQQCVITQGLKLSRITMLIPEDPIADKGNNCWHIPYFTDDVNCNRKHVPNTSWACFNMGPIYTKKL